MTEYGTAKWVQVADTFGGGDACTGELMGTVSGAENGVWNGEGGAPEDPINSL